MQEVKQEIADIALMKAVSMLALQQTGMKTANLLRQCSITIRYEKGDDIPSSKWWVILNAPLEIFQQIDFPKESAIKKAFQFVFIDKSITSFEIRLAQDQLPDAEPKTLVDTMVLASQQNDFIKRLKVSTSNLLRCDIAGLHSEIIAISSENTSQLRDFCWKMSDKFKNSSQTTREIFISTMKGKLGEEALVNLLSDYVTGVDYELKFRGDGKYDFTLSSNASVRLQVKARNGSIPGISWFMDLQEIEVNDVLVCFLIEEEVSEAQPEYHVISAGFLPTEMIKKTNLIEIDGKKKAVLKIEDLLYVGGLKSYLDLLENKNKSCKEKCSTSDLNSLWDEVLSNMQPNSTQILLKMQGKLVFFDGGSAVIGMHQALIKIARSRLSQIEAAFKVTCKENVSINFQAIANIQEMPQTFDLAKVWEGIVSNIQPSSTQILLRQQGKLLFFDGKNAVIGHENLPLLKIIESRRANIEAAFEEIYKEKIGVSFKAIDNS